MKRRGLSLLMPLLLMGCFPAGDNDGLPSASRSQVIHSLNFCGINNGKIDVLNGDMIVKLPAGDLNAERHKNCLDNSLLRQGVRVSVAWNRKERQ